MDYMIFNVHTDINACDCTRGCTDTVNETALKVDCGRKKILCRSGESNLHQRSAGPMLYQLSYLPIPATSPFPSSLRECVSRKFSWIVAGPFFFFFFSFLDQPAILLLTANQKQISISKMTLSFVKRKQACLHRSVTEPSFSPSVRSLSVALDQSLSSKEHVLNIYRVARFGCAESVPFVTVFLLTQPKP